MTLVQLRGRRRRFRCLTLTRSPPHTQYPRPLHPLSSRLHPARGTSAQRWVQLRSPAVRVTLSRTGVRARVSPSVNQEPLSCSAGLLRKLTAPEQPPLLCADTSLWPHEGRHGFPITQLALSLPGNCSPPLLTRESKLKVRINLKKHTEHSEESEEERGDASRRPTAKVLSRSAVSDSL